MTGQFRTMLALGGGVALLAAAPAALAGSHATGTTVTVTEGKPSSFRYTLSPKTFPHGKVTFVVTNMDSSGLAHDFKWCTATTKTDSADTCTGKGTAILGANQTAKLTVTIPKAGTYEYLCTVAGHAAAGMKGLAKVT
jgi:uncharacterized cupredoxin-like copper-binding protein